MESLTKLLSQIELVADDIIDTKQQIINFENKRNKTREALNRLKEIKNGPYWVCAGDMFLRLNNNQTRNLIVDDQYHIDTGLEKLRDDLHEKVEQLRVLEGKPERSGFNLKPLDKKEILSLRTAFKI